jgi:hypothetical protein
MAEPGVETAFGASTIPQFGLFVMSQPAAMIEAARRHGGRAGCPERTRRIGCPDLKVARPSTAGGRPPHTAAPRTPRATSRPRRSAGSYAQIDATRSSAGGAWLSTHWLPARTGEPDGRAARRRALPGRRARAPADAAGACSQPDPAGSAPRNPPSPPPSRADPVITSADCGRRAPDFSVPPVLPAIPTAALAPGRRRRRSSFECP